MIQEDVRAVLEREGYLPATFSVPASVRIGYIDYVVEEMPEDCDDEGEINSSTRAIKVRTKGRAADYVANTIIHECVHGIVDNAGLDKLPKFRRYEEAIVTAIANGLSSLFRDNPLILEMFRR